MDQERQYSQTIDQIRSTYKDELYQEYYSAWNLLSHSVFDKSVRKDGRQTEVYQVGDRELKRQVTIPVNRIGLPIEQDIVNIHTSFCVGIDPDLRANPEGELENAMLGIIKDTERWNKIRNRNKEIVRSFLSEAMVAEYWFTTDAGGFYRKHSVSASNRLKMVVWSPFRGDKLVPIKNTTGDLVRFLRFYKVGDIHRAMDIDSTHVRTLEHKDKSWFVIDEFAHGFGKIPVIYMERREPLCAKIKHIRERLETLASNFADNIDYNAAPKLVARGQIAGLQNIGKSQLVELNGQGASLEYLTWSQSADAVQLEMEQLLDYAYQMTNTPRISLKDMQGAGNGFSGESFRYVFMGTHMEVRNHEEIIGEYLQRRYSFLLTTLAQIIPALDGAQYMEIDPTLVPYIIERDETRDNKA